ncbi:MAG: YqjK-like family protein [Zoogloea sp.]|jgi:hypothetical protein|uniref:YqjK-like family protein n=1 Tax=Zoogloea sp. TaxID=49181 RepID=UPI0026262618|nr:YqjK-like family protein [Zoogloea sp.]MDD3326257.1 YqjK-like family protein [Zoogloea sp.]
MSPELVELALRKQRLQIRSAEQREALVAHARAFAPVLGGIDRIADSVRWARDNAPILSGVAIFVLVARPRAALRWARRGWISWQFLQRVRKLVS